MSLKELIDNFAEKAGTTKKAARESFDALVAVIQEELAKPETQSLVIPGIVTFKKAESAARTGRNPSTGETIQIPAKTVVRAKPAKVLKDLVKG